MIALILKFWFVAGIAAFLFATWHDGLKCTWSEFREEPLLFGFVSLLCVALGPISFGYMMYAKLTGQIMSRDQRKAWQNTTEKDESQS